MSKLRVILFRERISPTAKVWVAQLLEHDFNVQGKEHEYPATIVENLIDHLDTHQLLALREDACNPVERVVCAPPEYFDLWERSPQWPHFVDPKRTRVHEEGKENPFPMWDLDVRIDHKKLCTSYDAGNFIGCCPTPMKGLVFGECQREAFVLFRHPEKPVGHYRCLEHAEQDAEVFQKSGWRCEELMGPWQPRPARL